MSLKIFTPVVILYIFLALSSIFGQNTYFISYSQGSDKNSGRSESEPIKSISKLNSINFQPGDRVFFKRGDIWVGQSLRIINSGTSDKKIIFSAYGEGKKPIITLQKAITKNWTKLSKSIYFIETPINSSVPIERIWLNGLEEEQAVSLDGNNNDGTAGICKEHPFYHDLNSNRLYLYSESDPNNYYKNIEYQGGLLEDPILWHTLELIGADYLIFIGLDFQGGGYGSIGLAGSDYVTFENCNIGLYSSRAGIYANSGRISNLTDDKNSNFGAIKNCIINSDWEYTLKFYTKLTPYGVLLVGGSNNWEISKNVFVDWWFGIYSGWHEDNNNLKSQYHKIHHNDISSPRFSFAKGMQIYGNNTPDESVDQNGFHQVYNNYIHDITAVGISVGSSGNKIFFNIIDGITVSRNPDKASQSNSGFGIQTRHDYQLKLKDNYYFNNTFIRTNNHQLSGNYPFVFNNLFLEANLRSSDPIAVAQGSVKSNKINFKNNLFYNSGSNSNSKFVADANDFYSIIEFNNSNSNISQNIYPTINNLGELINDDYTLAKGSQAFNAGTDISKYVNEGFTDRNGFEVDFKNPNIGALSGNNTVDDLDNNFSGFKVFLEAPFNGTNMENSFSQLNILPESHPYKNDPWLIDQISTISNLDNNYIDWLIIELWDDKSSHRFTKLAILNNDGIILNTDSSPFLFNNISSGNYYIIIRHRNHLSIVSSSKVLVKDTMPIKYDFTDSDSRALGTDQLVELSDGVFGMIGGDADANGIINNLDFGVVANNVLLTGYSQADLDMNGIVNVLDYTLINKNILKSSQAFK